MVLLVWIDCNLISWKFLKVWLPSEWFFIWKSSISLPNSLCFYLIFDNWYYGCGNFKLFAYTYWLGSLCMWGGCIEFFIKYNFNGVGVHFYWTLVNKSFNKTCVSNSNVINKGINRYRMVNVVVDVTQVWLASFSIFQTFHFCLLWACFRFPGSDFWFSYTHWGT